MEWTREKTLSLINEYRRRRGLWDLTHEDYRKKEIKQKLLAEVAVSLGGNIPVVEIEKKFHTLRTQYHREISRMNRKEPYNSKWFGFRNLQFLSSPKACRMGKGRIKSEINEDGTVTKYIIRETIVPASVHESDGFSESISGSNSNLNEEFLTIQQQPRKCETTYDESTRSAAAALRSRELEKLIEETTKDVEETVELKPKIARKIKERKSTALLESHNYSAPTSNNDEMMANENNSLESQHQMEEEQHVATIDLQPGEEITYQAPGDGAHLHHQAIPARIIKVQRRHDSSEADYYDDDEHQQQLHQTDGARARIYYECNGQPISTSKSLRLSSVQQAHDEFCTYGEYVANEMRGLKSREVLISLKHKINTALFDASMAELRK